MEIIRPHKTARRAAIVLGCDACGYVADLSRLLKERSYTTILLTNSASDAVRNAYDVVHLNSNMFDVDALTKTIKSFKKQFTPGLIVTQVDFLLSVGAELSKTFLNDGNNMSGISNAKNKYLTRELLKKAGLSHVKYYLVKHAGELDAAIKTMNFPMVIKPIGGWGSNYVFKIHDECELANKFSWINGVLDDEAMDDSLFEVQWQNKLLNLRRHFLVEEYIEGTEFAVDGYVYAGEVQVLAIHQKIDSLEDNGFRDTFYLTPPQNLDEETVLKTRIYVSDAIRAIGLESALFHVELRVRGTGEIEMIEVNPRLGGGSVRDNIINLTGVDPLRIFVDMQHDEMGPVQVDERGIAFGCGVVIKNSGMVRQIHGLDYVRSLSQVRQVRVAHPQGTIIPKVVGEVYGVIVNCVCQDYEEALMTRKLIMDNINIVVEE